MDYFPFCSKKKWTFLQNPVARFMEQGFVHDRFFTVNFLTQSQKVKFFLNESFSRKAEQISAEDNMLILLPFIGQSTVLTHLHKEGFKVHIDSGKKTLEGTIFNIYGSFQAQRNSKQQIWKAGILTKNPQVTNDMRFRYSRSNHNVKIYYKFSIQEQSWGFSKYTVYDITAYQLKRVGVQMGWKSLQANHQAYVSFSNKSELESTPSSLLSIFNMASFNFLAKIGHRTRAAAQMNFNLRGQLQESFVAIEHKYIERDTVFKTKISTARALSASVQSPIKAYGTYTFGLQLRDVGTSNKLSCGVKLDLNL